MKYCILFLIVLLGCGTPAPAPVRSHYHTVADTFILPEYHSHYYDEVDDEWYCDYYPAETIIRVDTLYPPYPRLRSRR